MNNSINNTSTNTLIETLNAMLKREQDNIEGVVFPKTEAEHNMFSAGYAEAISDIIMMLKS